MHCDTISECFQASSCFMENDLHVDVGRGSAYRPWVQVLAAWIPDTLRGEAAFEFCCDILDFAYNQAVVNSDCMQLVNTAEDLDAGMARKACTAILAVEGGAALGGEIRRLDDLARRSVKVITLTWNGENELGYGCGCEGKEQCGLTPFGKTVIKQMERQRMIPDVSHLNQGGFWDVAETVSCPFIASHSVSAAVHTHARNLTDAQFDEICRRGGLVGLNLCESQLGEQSFERFEKHLDHFLSRGGERCLGLGCDMDGTDLPSEWGGIQSMEKLFDYLCRKNYDEQLLDRLFFGNCYDFFHQALTTKE